MKNSNLDKILRKLGDFDPRATPNWEGFLADNESHLQNPDSAPDQVFEKSTRYSRGVQHIGIVFLVIATLFTTWYFAEDLIVTSEKTPEKHQATQPLENATVPAESKTGTFTIDETESISEQPKYNSDEIQSQVNNNLIDAVYPISIEEIEPDKILEPTVLQKKPQNSNDVIISDTVIIRKTIYIKDTVRMKKIIKK